MLLSTCNRSVGDTAVLDCHGSIVFGEETALLRHRVQDLLSNHHHIVLNLAHVYAIDSVGVGTLVGLYTSAQKAGSNIKLAGVTGKVWDVLQITKLTMVFETYATVGESVASFLPQSSSTLTAQR